MKPPSSLQLPAHLPPPGLQQLLWWLQAWRLIGLDSPEEAFDVVVMVHPDMAGKVLLLSSLAEGVPRASLLLPLFCL